MHGLAAVSCIFLRSGTCESHFVGRWLETSPMRTDERLVESEIMVKKMDPVTQEEPHHLESNAIRTSFNFYSLIFMGLTPKKYRKGQICGD
jgi:hypothetical protein